MDKVEGERIAVVEGKIDCNSWAIFGVCDVPPERMTCVLVSSIRQL